MIKRFVLPGVALVALATCASTPSTTYYGRGTCEPRGVSSPDGECGSKIRQSWYERGTSVQLLVGCKADGFGHSAGVIGYKGHEEHSIGLHWLSNDKLEIAVAPGADFPRPSEGRWFSDGHLEIDGRNPADPRLGTPDPNALAIRTIQFSYRELTPKDPEWRHGCYLKRPKPKKP